MEQTGLQSPPRNRARWARVGGVPGHTTEDSASKPVNQELVAGVLPPAILQQDEIVLLLVKPSLWFILITSVRFILLTMLVGILLVQIFQHNPEPYLSSQSLATMAVLAALGRLLWALCVWTSHIYLLTNQRIVTIKGVVNVTIYQAHLRKIQQTVLYRPLLERLLGIGTLGFATAASAGDPDSTWVMIPRPRATQEQIAAAIEKAAGGGGNGA